MANKLAGRVRRVDPTGFNKVSALGIGEQRVNVIVGVTDSLERWQSLGHGHRVDAHIIVWRYDDVLAVPVSALFRHREAWTVKCLRTARRACARSWSAIATARHPRF